MPPIPKTLNPQCPHCKGKAQKNKLLKSGRQQYKCTVCKRCHTPGKTVGGRPPVDDPSPAALRQRKSRAAKRTDE